MGYGPAVSDSFSIGDAGPVEVWYSGELSGALVVEEVEAPSGGGTGGAFARASRAGDRRADAVVILRTADGEWTTVGTDQARGIVPQAINVDASAWGPDTCSFALARDPRTAWPDLEAFTRAEVWVAGQPVWGGRIWGTPSSERTLNVTGRGWHHHLDDDLLERGYVHTNLGDYRDQRSFLTADLASQKAAPQVQAGDGAIMLVFPAGYTVANNEQVVATFDAGAALIKRAVVTWERVGISDADDTVRSRGCTSENAATAGDDSTAVLTGASGTISHTFAAARRFHHVMVYRNGAGGTFGADQGVRITAIKLFGEAAWESGGVSDLQASEVITDVLASGAVPLLSSSAAGIEATTFDIPDLWPSEPWTARQYLEAVNAYHGYILQVDPEGRVVFRQRPSTPALEVQLGAGATFSDTSLNNAEELYDTVIVEATGPAGTPLRVTRTLASPVLTRQGFSRATRLSVGAAASQAALEVIGDVWLAERARTQLRGALTITGKGGLRRVDGGEALHPSEVVRHVGERIRFPQLTDPDTDDVGRDGLIGSASYSHDTETASIAIDADPSRLDVLLNRYGAIAAAVR